MCLVMQLNTYKGVLLLEVQHQCITEKKKKLHTQICSMKYAPCYMHFKPNYTACARIQGLEVKSHLRHSLLLPKEES